MATLMAQSIITPVTEAAQSSKEQSIETLQQKIDMIAERTMAISANLAALPSSLKDSRSLDSNLARQFPTSSMTPEQLLWLHRVLLSSDGNNIPADVSGFRRVTVWIVVGSPLPVFQAGGSWLDSSNPKDMHLAIDVLRMGHPGEQDALAAFLAEHDAEESRPDSYKIVAEQRAGPGTRFIYEVGYDIYQLS